MLKVWSILFAVVLGAEFALWAAAPFFGWWLPPQVSSFGGEVDNLYNVILGFTGFFFVLTEVILVIAMWKFAYNPARKVTYIEGNFQLEMAWTAVPAAILVYIGLAQMSTWAKIKYQAQMPGQSAEKPVDVVMQVTARQWEWRVRYAGDITLPYGNASPEAVRRGWAEAPWADDLVLPNEIHTWKGANVKLYLKTNDVLHSFFLPNLRLKQDALPGKTIPVWFNAIESNVNFTKDFDRKAGRWKEPAPEKDWELACAELCGGGHYRMRGRLYVHEDKADFEKWLEYIKKKQNERTVESSTTLAANQ